MSAPAVVALIPFTGVIPRSSTEMKNPFEKWLHLNTTFQGGCYIYHGGREPVDVQFAAACKQLPPSSDGHELVARVNGVYVLISIQQKGKNL